MKFSLFSVLDYYKDVSHPVEQLYEETLGQIVYAEQLGFEAFWLGEHHFYINPRLALALPNPALLLSAAAPRTTRIGLNTAVANLSLRHPLQLAEDYAMLDMLSRGRLGLGIGRGAYTHEYAVFGQSKEESLARLEEAWKIVKMAWCGEEVNFEGRFYQIKGARLNVLPVQKPWPGHWFAAMSVISYANRGRAGEPIIVMPYLSAQSFEMMSELAGQYHQNYLEAGHNPQQYDLPLVFHTYLAKSEEEAHKIALPALQRFIGYQHPGHDREAVKALHQRQQLLIGTPEKIIELIEKYRIATGSDHFIFWMDFGAIEPRFVRHSMELLAKNVMPYFQGGC